MLWYTPSMRTRVPSFGQTFPNKVGPCQINYFRKKKNVFPNKVGPCQKNVSRKNINPQTAKLRIKAWGLPYLLICQPVRALRPVASCALRRSRDPRLAVGERMRAPLLPAALALGSLCTPPPSQLPRPTILRARCSQPTRFLTPTMIVPAPDVPSTAVGVDGGDQWIGSRVSSDELRSLADLACSTTITKPIVAQYYPSRIWLWRQWSGTVLRRVLPKEVFFNLCFAAAVCLFFRVPGPRPVWRAGLVESLAGVAKVWTISGSMASFILSFFLSQSYTMWRSVYSITRRVQGRLNDVGLLCATFAQRNATDGGYTPEAEDSLRTVARYCRLFHMLFYASVSSRFAPLKTPQGLSALVANGALTAEARQMPPGPSPGPNPSPSPKPSRALSPKPEPIPEAYP